MATSVLAVSSASAADLVSNGGFPSGIADWHLVGRGSMAHSADGSGAPGSLEIDGGLAGDATQAVAGQCISPVSPGQALEFEASVRVVSGSPANCRVALFESDRDDCLWIDLGAEVRRTTFSTGWDNLAGGTLTTSVWTRSVEVRLHCANAGGDTDPLQVRFDNVAVNTTGVTDVIFSDGFESGNTSAWSSVVP